MGCPNSKEEEEPIPEPKEAPPKKVDPRLPFETYRQFFNMKNSWKTVVRSMTGTSKEMLLMFFQRYPHHKALHKKLARFTEDEQMIESQAFENAALDIFNTIDEVMECAEDKVDFVLSTLQRVGKAHGNIPGFKPEYFTDMEGVFMEVIKNLFGDRWTDSVEDNFRRLWQFVTKTMIDAMPPPPEGTGDGDANRI